MKLRQERINDDPFTMNQFLMAVIEKYIQIIKDDHPTLQDLQNRNIKRFKQLKECSGKTPRFYCPMIHSDIDNLMECHIACSFGHMTECHFPYDCNSDFCNHYPNEQQPDLTLNFGEEEVQ